MQSLVSMILLFLRLRGFGRRAMTGAAAIS
jgi:hypothetical protein